MVQSKRTNNDSVVDSRLSYSIYRMTAFCTSAGNISPPRIRKNECIETIAVCLLPSPLTLHHFGAAGQPYVANRRGRTVYFYRSNYIKC